MKNIVLIGDSIRGGYQETVQQELAGAAEVWGPEKNGGNTVNVLVHLHLWVLRRQPDLVHINCGLHDLRTIFYGGRDNVVPVDHYRDNVERILRTIHEQTQARIIWATTTPINEQKAHAAHAAAHDFDRFEADVLAYNQAATEVATGMGVPINDLYATVMQAGRDECLTEDGVHFTPAASALLGRVVAAAIMKQL